MFTKLIVRRLSAGPRIKAALTLVFTACLLVAGDLAAHAATLDMRGSWTLDVTAGNVRSIQTLEVVSMDLGTGAFRGNLIYSGQRASVAGKVSGSKVTFQSTPASASASKWVGDVLGNGVALKVSGTLTPGQGQGGTFRGSRITAAVPLDTSKAGGQAGGGGTKGSRPPLPPNARELSPGQLPRQCVAGDGGTQGYYFSDRSKQWVEAPFCYGRWGNLEASGSQIVAAGATATVTAIPTDGSNSGTYAPQTGSIQWQYPGKVVSGCGAGDLTCTVIPTKVASSEWQWFQFHVSMPRTFFIDSPGDLCGGQHLCAGVSTNAWSYVGIAPARAATVAGGGGPAGGQGTGSGSSGPNLVLIIGAAALAAAAVTTAILASGNQFAIMERALVAIKPYIDSTNEWAKNMTPDEAQAKMGHLKTTDEMLLANHLAMMQPAGHPPEPPPASADNPFSAQEKTLAALGEMIQTMADDAANMTPEDLQAKMGNLKTTDEMLLANHLAMMQPAQHPQAPSPSPPAP